MVMEPFCKSARARSADDATTWKHGNVANTLNTFDLGETRVNELVVVEKPVICLQGNGIDRADTAGCNGKGWKEDTAYTLNTIDRPAVVFAVDQGGGKSSANVTENKAPTLCTTHGGEPAVAYGLDRASFNQGQNAKYDFTITEESQPTLTARGPGAVAQPVYNSSKASFFMRASKNGPADTLVATDYKDPQMVIYPIHDDVHKFVEENNADAPHQQDLLQTTDGVARTIACGSNASGSHLTKTVINHGTHYIVRRLTPTECARLQGFADRWGDIDAVDRFSAKDYQFWKEVRNTHAAINGKKVQDYTVKQMVAWYNKLQTDSSEYKMWGNGIALPTALYVLQGITDALEDATLLGE